MNKTRKCPTWRFTGKQQSYQTARIGYHNWSIWIKMEEDKSLSYITKGKLEKLV